MARQVVYVAANILPSGSSGSPSVHATKEGAQRRFSWYDERIAAGLAQWRWTPGHWWGLWDDDLGLVAEVRRTVVRS